MSIRQELPSLEEPPQNASCSFCGEPIRVIGFCAICSERLALEKRIQDGNDYRRQAQVRLELQSVRQRVQVHIRREKPFDPDACRIHDSDTDPGTGRP